MILAESYTGTQSAKWSTTRSPLCRAFCVCSVLYPNFGQVLCLCSVQAGQLVKLEGLLCFLFIFSVRHFSLHI